MNREQSDTLLGKLREFPANYSVDELGRWFFYNVAAIVELLEQHAAYEAATRETVCWGVECVHQAEAMNRIASSMKELDDLRAQVAGLRQEAHDMAKQHIQDLQEAYQAGRMTGEDGY